MKIVKLFAALSLTAVLFLSGCIYFPTGGTNTPSGNVESRKYDYGNFDSIDIGSAFEVVITRSDVYNVTVTADQNLFNDILVEKQGNTLKIGIRTINFLFRQPCKAEISLPVLKKLILSGASHGSANGVVSDGDMTFDISGASRLEINANTAANARAAVSGASRLTGQLKAGGKADLSVSGASQCILNGSAGSDATFEASGASSLDMSALTIPNATVRLSGASNAIVKTDGKLNVDLSGASRLRYLGNPGINTVNVSGGSSLERG